MPIRGVTTLLPASFAVIIAAAVIAAQTPQAPTFSKDVAPILYKNCVNCHRTGAMAPMALVTYAQARPYARAIRERVELGSMPPWHAEAPEGTFLNERRLAATDKTTLARWVEAGAPEGDPRNLPPAPVFVEGWSIGQPDAVVSMAQPFYVPPTGTIAYQYFQVPTNFSEDKWVKAIEIRPGAVRAVHHVLVFASEPGGRPRQIPFTQSLSGGSPLNAAELLPVLTNALTSRLQAGPGAGAAGRGTLIATTAPGTNALHFAANEAMRIPAGSVLTLQVHYTATGKPEEDRTSVGFVFAKQPPQTEVRSASFVNLQLVIPPGASNQRVDAQITFTQNVHIAALFPHTHLRGKSWEYRLVSPDGHEDVVLSVPHYDFNWQTYYQFTKPIAAPRGAKLVAIAHYDNSTNNKANPDPTAEVRWGDQTWEEMQYSGITFTVD